MLAFSGDIHYGKECGLPISDDGALLSFDEAKNCFSWRVVTVKEQESIMCDLPAKINLCWLSLREYIETKGAVRLFNGGFLDQPKIFWDMKNLFDYLRSLVQYQEGAIAEMNKKNALFK
jgi:hypothetical protein